LELLRPQVVHWDRMKCRHKPSILQQHHELFPIHTGVMRCLAQPLRGSTTTKRASDSTTRPNRLHTHTHLPKRLAHPRSPIPPPSALTARVAHAQRTRSARAPTSPCSTGFCAICIRISSSSSSGPYLSLVHDMPHRNTRKFSRGLPGLGERRDGGCVVQAPCGFGPSL